jgi:hypothetical protein
VPNVSVALHTTLLKNIASNEKTHIFLAPRAEKSGQVSLPLLGTEIGPDFDPPIN